VVVGVEVRVKVGVAVKVLVGVAVRVKVGVVVGVAVLMRRMKPLHRMPGVVLASCPPGPCRRGPFGGLDGHRPLWFSLKLLDGPCRRSRPPPSRCERKLPLDICR